MGLVLVLELMLLVLERHTARQSFRPTSYLRLMVPHDLLCGRRLRRRLNMLAVETCIHLARVLPNLSHDLRLGLV